MELTVSMTFPRTNNRCGLTIGQMKPEPENETTDNLQQGYGTRHSLRTDQCPLLPAHRPASHQQLVLKIEDPSRCCMRRCAHERLPESSASPTTSAVAARAGAMAPVPRVRILFPPTRDGVPNRCRRIQQIVHDTDSSNSSAHQQIWIHILPNSLTAFQGGWMRSPIVAAKYAVLFHDFG